jgi:cyclopropane-fatty-acyl-phospholipid synthase
MYEAFLSADMTYSCGVYPTLDADVGAARHASAKLAQLTNGAPRKPQGSGEFADDGPGGPTPPDAEARSDDGKAAKDELEAAQLTKLRLHIERADIRKGHRVLEIGTGWGSFAMEAVRRTGCTVESLTLSVEQKALAEARIAKAGMSGSIRVHLLDYRDMPASWNDSFDRVVSIEMLEAVGIEFLPTYFENVSRVLKAQGGAACFQCITMPESRFEAYAAGVDFIKKWIFPGGVLPSVTALIDAATRGSKGTLQLDAALSIGPHYARTLREWRQRFDAAFDEHVRPALLSDHKAIRELPAEAQAREVEVFRKKWTYYFVYCEVGFTERVIGGEWSGGLLPLSLCSHTTRADHILSFTREGNTSLPTCCG